MGIRLVHVLIAFLPFGLTAQVISSSVVGDAQDASGAAVPGASVLITNISTGASRTSTTDEAGGYVFPQLLPGD
jgi:carboxypeptidase family protein